MPYKDPVVREQYRKDYYEENKEIIIARATEYNKNNKEKKHRAACKSRWKKYGIISNNYDDIYDLYMKTENCQMCEVKLTTGKRCGTSKVLDHDHETGLFRNVLCHICNCKRRISIFKIIY